MNPLFLVTLLVAGAVASTQRHVPILRFSQEIRGGQSDNVQFETGNGIRSVFNTQVVPGRGSSFMDENGRMVQSDSSLEQSGHSYHELDNGRHIALTWVANEKGFQPTGDHLPQPVPLPAEHAEAHRQALAIAAANPPRPEDNMHSGGSGSYYSAPASQPAVVRVESYNAPAQPAVRVQSYSAPAPAPAIRVESYNAPAPAIRSSGY